jgi:hypothetical protein
MPSRATHGQGFTKGNLGFWFALFLFFPNRRGGNRSVPPRTRGAWTTWKPREAGQRGSKQVDHPHPLRSHWILSCLADTLNAQSQDSVPEIFMSR